MRSAASFSSSWRSPISSPGGNPSAGRHRPARPRTVARAALVLSALALGIAGAGAAWAQAPDSTAATGAAPDSTRHRAAPFKVMLRSAVLPGWGQVYNGKPLKAGIVVLGEGFLLYKAYDELQQENDAVDAANRATNEADRAAALDERDKHYNMKVNYIWWAVAVHLLQMADAYVDAHLADFSARLGPEPGFDAAGDMRLAMTVRLRF